MEVWRGERNRDGETENRDDEGGEVRRREVKGGRPANAPPSLPRGGASTSSRPTARVSGGARQPQCRAEQRSGRVSACFLRDPGTLSFVPRMYHDPR